MSELSSSLIAQCRAFKGKQQMVRAKWIELSSSAATMIETSLTSEITSFEDRLEQMREDCGPGIVNDEVYIEHSTWMETAKNTLDAIRSKSVIAIGLLVKVE